MAVEPTLVARESLGSLPASIDLPDGFDIDLRCVKATFDGTGAGGPFLACVSVVAASGQLIGRFFPSQTFSAGDSGEVTYGPFLEAAATSAPPSGGYPPLVDSAGVQILGPLTVNNTTWTTLTGWGGSFTAGSGTYVQAAAGPTRLQFQNPLAFVITGITEWLAAFAGDRWIRIGPNGGLDPATDDFAYIYLGNSGSSHVWSFFSRTFPVAGWNDLSFEVWQNSGVAQSISGDNTIDIVLLGRLT